MALKFKPWYMALVRGREPLAPVDQWGHVVPLAHRPPPMDGPGAQKHESNQVTFAIQVTQFQVDFIKSKRDFFN